MIVIKGFSSFCVILLRNNVKLSQISETFRNFSSRRNLVTSNVLIPNLLKKSFINKSQNESLLSSINFVQKSQISFSNLIQKTGGYGTHDNISSIVMKKRPTRKKKTLEEEGKTPGLFNVIAFATAEEYDLEKLFDGLKKEDLYEPNKIENADAVHAVAKYSVGKESRELFFFRDGGVVLWNVTDLESSNVLSFLRQYEQDSYSERLIQSESEVMSYRYQTEEGAPSCLDKDGSFVLSTDKDNLPIVKYTFSDAMFRSVKLGIWEASLEKYIEQIEDVTEDLKRGKRIKLSREEVLRKHGELFALRHYLNLSSDMLDTPDFYWENEQLENLYNQVCVYFAINKRTKVMNEKINHCSSLIELLSHHLGDKHHIRLEWMIIVLITVEVVFEIIHYIDRYMNEEETSEKPHQNVEFFGTASKTPGNGRSLEAMST